MVVLVAAYALATPGIVPAIGPLVAGRERVEARFVRCGSGPNRACVHDGDTFRIDGRKIRLLGIDAPELAEPRCMEERALAERATAILLEELNRGPFEMVRDRREERDRYGRELMRIEREEDGRTVSIGDRLVDAGLAEPYLGRKAEWCFGGR
nr:thermonuclease family protein [Sphingomicrobium nitratireducens]